MWEFDEANVRENARKAEINDLLDRVTVYRTSLEPQAYPILIEELQRRGIGPADIVDHQSYRGECLRDRSNFVRKCTLCSAPAVSSAWGWHQLFGKLPLFPRRFYYCNEHRR
jgi:hypothetical protein